MEFHDAANFLFDLRRFRPKPGTESTADLLAALGNPHEGVAFVQVAGSNGKGSTARMTESILRETGLTVGLYTSPHLDEVRDRIRVDGRPITEAALCEFVEQVEPLVIDRAAEGNAPTFFEVLTAMGLWEFGRRDVDVAVLEVGIGGRYDATSVVDPVASAITSVTLEHTGILGDSIEEIARDKAHVAPADAPLVTAVTGDALAAVEQQAGDVIVVGEEEGDDVRVGYGGRTNHAEAAVSLAGPDWEVETRIPLLGRYQAYNAGIAATLADGAGEVSGAEIARGLRRAHWPGRFEVMNDEPLTVLDGAHNPGACEKAASTLAEFEYDDLHLVIGAMHDKDHRGMAEALPHPTRVMATQPVLDRAEDRTVLAEVFERAGSADIETRESVAAALERALERADPDDCVLVTGSLATVGEARERWTRLDVPKRVRDVDQARGVLEGAHVDEVDVRRTSGAAVHRIVETRVQPWQARRLKEELLSLGGECATSALERQEGEWIDVVMTGTLSQFESLIEALEDRPRGLPAVANGLRERLAIGVESPSRGFPWEDRTAVMGILNVTPDSFHDGGRYEATEDAVARAEQMVEAGADVVDVGGESTRPGADPVPVEEEIDRVVPVVERIRDLDALLSIDTRKAEVARAALEAGADMLNDVSGLEDPEMRFVAAEYDVPLVVMHSLDTPVDPEREIEYDDVVEDVLRDLEKRVLLAEKAGLDREQIVVDPGLGFGKTAAESFELLGRVDELRALGCPVLIGHSQKSMFERVDRGPEDRTSATVAGTAIAAERGADVVRVHDVPENVAAVRAVETADDP